MNLLIGGIQYKVNFVDDLRSKEGKRVNGTLDTDACTIDVATDCSRQRQYSVMMHEILHAVHYHYDIDAGEHINYKISNGFYSFIVNNARFIKELIKNDEKLKKQNIGN